MNPARLLDALRARPAAAAAGGLILICLFGFFGALRPRPSASSQVLYSNSAPPTVTTLAREPIPVVSFLPKPPPTPTPPAPPLPPTPQTPPLPPARDFKSNLALATLSIHVELPPATNPPTGFSALGTATTNKPLPTLTLHANLPPETNVPPLSLDVPAGRRLPLPTLTLHANLPPDTNPPPLGLYAPAGRLLIGELVNTVESSGIDTPIIARVTEALWHNGRLVVPVGTEIHSRVRVDRLRDRLVASGLWTLVWQSGLELTVHGIALDCGKLPDGPGWELTDGSAGLRGTVLQGESQDELKLFGATFLSGMASGLQQSRDTVFGSQVIGNARNAALSGTSQVLNSYAQQVLEAIKRDGSYVRVPAGKAMYLYLTDTLDLSQAHIGNLRVGSLPAPTFYPVAKTTNKP